MPLSSISDTSSLSIVPMNLNTLGIALPRAIEPGAGTPYMPQNLRTSLLVGRKDLVSNCSATSDSHWRRSSATSILTTYSDAVGLGRLFFDALLRWLDEARGRLPPGRLPRPSLPKAP